MNPESGTMGAASGQIAASGFGMASGLIMASVCAPESMGAVASREAAPESN